MCERCNEPANWIDPRNKPVVNYPEIQQDWSSYYEPVPVMDHDYTVSSESDYDCCRDSYDQSYRKRAPIKRRPPRKRDNIYHELAGMPQPKPKSDIDWLTVISILGVIAFFAVMVYGQMKQQEQVSICYEQNQSEVSELC